MSAVPAIAQDQAQAEHFLTLLDETAETFCFRVFDDNEARKDPKLAAKIEGSLADAWPRLMAAQSAGCGVYVVANAGQQKNESIYRVRAVFADFDGAPMPARFDLEPHIIVQSSPGKWHVYWLVDGLALEAFKDVQRNIAARYGSDKSINDLARVMRLPGMLHQKGAPFLTHVIHESGELPYTAKRILAEFGTAPAPAAPAPTLADSVQENRHADVLKLTLLLAQSIRNGAMTRDEALALMRQRRDAGRWSRHVPDDEIVRALDGAIQKGGTVAIEAPSPTLEPIDLSDLMRADLEPPRFIVEPIIPRRVTTLLGGHGGVGKSMLSLTIGAHVAGGRPWGPFEFQQGRVVVASLEDGADLVRYRLRRIIEECRLPAADVLGGMRIFDLSDMEAELAVEVNEAGVTGLAFTPMMQAVCDAMKGADLVLIDNASDAYGGNEVARRQVRAFIRRLTQEAKANDAAVVLLAHIDKQAAKNGGKGNNYSGSTQWHNSVRSRLALVDNEGSVELLHEKSNLGPTAEPVLIQRGRFGVPAVATPNAAMAARALMSSHDAEAVLAAMQAAIEAGQTIPTAESGPHTTWHALVNQPELGEPYRNREGKRRVAAALVALERAGRIWRESFKKPNRHDGQRWQLAQTDANEAGEGAE